MQPQTRQDLQHALLEAAQSICQDLNATAPDLFFRGDHEHWSPAHHIQHLIQSQDVLGKGITLVRLTPVLTLGKSRSYEEMKNAYINALGDGVRIQGDPTSQAFVPKMSGVANEENKNKILAQLEQSAQRLGETGANLSDAQLDGLRLPHPLLGLCSLRELLMFSHHHSLHHRAGIQKLLQ